MAKITIEDDDKIMDVSKPGKGKIVGTSRPVVAPITSDEPAKTESTNEVASEEQPQQSSPSQTHKVIQPLHDQESNPEEEPKIETVEPIAESSDSPAESSDSAGVNALAESMSSKKEELKKEEEKAQKDAEVKALIDSKKYVVPISKEGSSSGGKGSKYLLVALIFLVLGLVVGYALVDAKVIKVNISLPYEFIKETEEPKSNEVVRNSPDNEESVELLPPATDVDNDKTITTPDEERKKELKDLSIRAEETYADTGKYPKSLNDLNPVPTNAELTGPANDVYVYTTGSQYESFTLSAKLDNKQDIDADENGNYVILSLNQ